MTETKAIQSFNELSTPQQKEHRKKIGVRAEAILSSFWQKDMPDVVKAIEIEGWMDVLENYSHYEIRSAWKNYQHDSRNYSANDRLRKPCAGDLYRIIVKNRPKLKLVSQTKEEQLEPARQPVSPERASQILRDVGFNPKRFGRKQA